MGHESTIDHFLVSSDIYETLHECKGHYECTNPSNHNVVNFICRCSFNNVVTRQTQDNINSNRLAWLKASDSDKDLHRVKLDELLGNVCIPSDVIMCKNTMCANVEHRKAIDNFCHSIISCCLDAGSGNIPGRKLHKRGIPDWKEKVKPEREHSMFWYWIWLECGRPNTGYVYEIMKQSRHKYHYAVRCAKRYEFEVKKHKRTENIENVTDFWSELKKLNPVSRKIPLTMDEACGSQEIAELFVTKYEQLYNSVPTCENELTEISDIVNNNICEHSSVNISYCTIDKCVKKLKCGKSDGNLGVDSDHLLNGTQKLLMMLGFLINMMIMHGHTASDFLLATIISIPKNMRSSLCCSDNYRGIALCSSICKLLDLVIMEEYSEYLYTSVTFRGIQVPREHFIH